MRRAAIVLVLVLAACSEPGGTATISTTAVTVTTAPAMTTASPPAVATPTTAAPPTTPTTRSSVAPSTTATTADLPNCADVEPIATATGWDHLDCQFVPGGDPPSTFTVRYGDTDPATGRTPLTIEVNPGVGGPTVPIDELIGATFEAPHLDDLDANGDPELLVPLETGNVNTTYAVWVRPRSGAFDLMRAGEVSAFDFAVSQDGYIVALSRGSAAVYSASFLRLVDGELVAIATAESALDVGTCTLIDDGGLAAIGLDVASASERFCNDPAVVSGT